MRACKRRSHVEVLLDQGAVRHAHLAVVGGAHDERLVGQAGGVQGVEQVDLQGRRGARNVCLACGVVGEMRRQRLVRPAPPSALPLVPATATRPCAPTDWAAPPSPPPPPKAASRPSTAVILLGEAAPHIAPSPAPQQLLRLRIQQA